MKKLIIDKIPRIIKLRKKLEKELNIKITTRGKEIYIQGEPENEYIAEKIIDALEIGFSFKDAILIKEENFLFECINIKDYTNRKDISRIRARLIGKNGRTKNTLEQLTKSAIEINELHNIVGIICPSEFMQNAQEAIISIIQGSKQSNVYASLEKNQPKPILDLGLKEEAKKYR